MENLIECLSVSFSFQNPDVGLTLAGSQIVDLRIWQLNLDPSDGLGCLAVEIQNITHLFPKVELKKHCIT